MDTLITIIFFVVAAILSAIMRKKQSDSGNDDVWPDQSSPGSPDESGRPATPSRRESWEDELKRLLEGKSAPETTEPAPPAPGPPPPPLPPPAAPTRRSTQAPRRASQPTQPSAAPSWLRKLEAQKEEAAQKAKRLREKKSAASERLQKSMEHLRVASQIDDRAAQTIRNAANRIHFHAKETRGPEVPGDIREGIRLLQSPESLRSAMVASIILGPPKAMEFESGQGR